jgi:hypothetical protein
MLLVLVVISQGCIAPHSLPPPLLEWTQTYEGTTLPDNQEVKLYLRFENNRSIIVIDNVIYTKSLDDAVLAYKLKPGVHRIDYYLKVFTRNWAIGGFTIDMKVGHTYVLKYHLETHVFQPWERTVTLRDETEDENVQIDKIQSTTLWNENIQISYEKHIKVGQ